jgi:hypothetical protein
MRKTLLAAAFVSTSVLPAFAMECSPASKVTARAPVEAKEQQAVTAPATVVTDTMKAEALKTASATEDKKVQ